jgi:hypothetical protein
VGSVCHIKQFTTVLRNMAKCFSDKEVETEVREWLRQ